MNNRRHVALIIETSNDYARGLLHGIKWYMREHEPWAIYLGEHERGAAAPAWLSRWKGDGIIARIENRKIADAVTRSKLPVVDVSAARLVKTLPWVETDDRAIAKTAAEHLLERGFKHFAYCGDDTFNWSTWRAQNFSHFLGEAGHKVNVFTSSNGKVTHTWDRERARLVEWIRELPKPIGVLACYDVRGRQILEACRDAGVAVPDEVAVLGVDNDALLCDLADPPLSSVMPNTRLTGYRAAELLDRMMKGEDVEPEAHLIRPAGVATRLSTDVLAIEDHEVSAAVRFIREHACEGINVERVLDEVPLSRRILESRFRKLIGRTPHEEIVRVQLDHVKDLLCETDLTLSDIAHRCGFSHSEYLSVVFKKKEGVTASEYRKLHRR
ncbi:MAG: AraC family transcriptional regulator [Phycisphaera sp.]|nr:AraC family transcriptional regulator [Phycisphaera sp.]